MVSARDQDKEKALALDMGADDYLTKPFSSTELLARIRVALRHMYKQGGGKTQTLFQVGELQLDAEKMCIRDSIEGAASVDESAITGESAPVIREAGGDRSAVTGGTTVLSDWIVVRITSEPGESFLDKMIAMVEGAARKKTPNEIALQIFLCLLYTSRCV